MLLEYRKERKIHSTADIAWISTDQGAHFFDADTLRAFGSRVSESVYKGSYTNDGMVHLTAYYFVTSERFSDGRYYTVRVAYWHGDKLCIDNASAFGAFGSRATAHRKAAIYARNNT